MRDNGKDQVPQIAASDLDLHPMLAEIPIKIWIKMKNTT